MGAQYKPVKGDRVRVVLEGEVAQVYSDGDFGIELVEHYRTDFPHEADISVEKIEPPVEVFKPGDVVRSKDTGWHYMIGKTHYLNIHGSLHTVRGNEFNSRYFEKVSLG